MAVLTHMLQVASDHGTWVDDLGLWGCPTAAAAELQARGVKRLPGRTILADRAYRVVDVATGEPTVIELM
jgi:hypothetical protein